MKKTDYIWNLEERLYNPKPNVKKIKFERMKMDCININLTIFIGKLTEI